MAVLPTFDPQGRPGEAVDAGLQGFSTGLSWMDKIQQMRQRQDQDERAQAQEQRNQAIFEVTQPVRQAAAQADLVTAQATLANATRMQNLRTQAAAVSKQANDDFIDANQLADFDAKASALAEVQQKYSWMSLLPEYKGFVDTVNHARADAHASAVADMNMERQLEASRLSNEARHYATDVNADVRRDTAQINTEAKIQSAEIGAKSRVDSAKERSNRTYELEKTKALYDKAVEDGDQAGADIFSQRIQKLNHITKTAYEASMEGSQPAATQTVKPASAMVADKYKTGAIYKDAAGKRAKYLGEGKWEPIE